MARKHISGKVKWVDKDRGMKALAGRLGHGLDGLGLRVGVQGDAGNAKHPESDLSVAEIAAIQEFGSAPQRIPARPFLGTAFEAHGSWRSLIARAGRLVVDGMAPADALLVVGKQAVQDVQAIIDTGARRFVPLAPSTVDNKGHADPLVETGTLREAISAEVHRGQTKVK